MLCSRHPFYGALVALSVLLTGCAAPDREDTGSVGAGILGDNAPWLNPFKRSPGADSAASARSGRLPAQGFVDPGRDPAAPRAQDRSSRPGTDVSGDRVTLNFVNVEIQEFVRVAFDEIFKEPVVIDPAIQGRITVRSGESISKAQAVDMVRAALETYGIRLAKQGNVYHVSSRGTQPGQPRADGNTRVVRLRHISPDQAKAAIQPMAGGQVEVSANSEGRYLLLSGPAADVDGLVQLIDALDVDQMRSVSIALVPLKEASAGSVAQELTQVFGGGRESPDFRAMPIQRVNAVLITARSRDTLARAQTWVRKLDQTGRDSRRVYVYQLQNRRANEVAQILQGMFAQGNAQTGNSAERRSPVAPGLTPGIASFAGNPVNGAPPQGGTNGPAPGVEVSARNPEDGVPLDQRNGIASGVSIRADVSTNSVVAIAKPEDYRIMEAALRRLDVLPSQVLIEATIVEVGLNDALRHGVRWFFQNGNHGASLTDSPAGSFGNVYSGFNYTFSAGNARVVVNALERITDVEIVSSPALTVLDNQTATLKIGDQVPIATRSARSVTSPDAPQVNEIEMKDTGIILAVTPRVNSSGLVMLDISQEASSVVPTTTSTIASPTIRQRKINSSVAVQSGSEVILGGIISRQRDKAKEGIPGLMHIPLIGGAFTSLAKDEKSRTELLVIIRPTVVNSRQDLHALTQEIKARMPASNAALYRR